MTEERRQRRCKRRRKAHWGNFKEATGSWPYARCSTWPGGFVFFRPDAGKVQGPLYWIGAGCLVVAAIAGVAGAVFIALGASGLAAGTGPNGWWFALSAIAAYILLAWATAHFWNRPITTELLLFVAWGALELYAACALEAGGILGLTATWCLAAIIFCVFALSLACLRSVLPPAATPSFVAGALPLSAVGIFSTILPLLL